ncbi:DUF4192 domain-containing protein [Williamsia sp. Leaf354]|uniref:DUF4192 domain-containing protein n=1 Tax=Williamsia sp. Leaf354 TaxID=1736349 RepID=UPI0012E3F793|nr:DUF4192 domain-containing protein [Williamsia sp. Leaf354]
MSIEPTTVTLHDPGDLIAAVPAMLGFVPQRSLVLLTFGGSGSRVEVTMRHDIDLDPFGEPSEAMCAVIEHLCGVCLRERASAVVAVVVDDRIPGDDPRWASVFDVIDLGLADLGLAAGFATDEIASGARWYTAWGHPDHHLAGGRLADPRFTPTAVAHAVTTGRVMAGSRAEMTAAVEPGAHCERGICAADATVSGPTPDDTTRLRLVLAAVDSGLGTDPRCADVVALGDAIRSVHVRDALLALAASDRADDAQHLWADLTRRLRGRGRATAATLLAHLHYVAGDGAMAGIALDAALAADPGNSFATLLDESLRAGMRPDVLAELLPTSRDLARRLGVALPPTQHRMRRGA